MPGVFIVIIPLFNFMYEEEENERKEKHKSEDWNASLKGLMNNFIQTMTLQF